MEKIKTPRRSYQKAHLRITFRTDIPKHKQARTGYIEGRTGVQVEWPHIVIRNASIVRERRKIIHFETFDGTVFFWDIEGKGLVASFDIDKVFS